MTPVARPSESAARPKNFGTPKYLDNRRSGDYLGRLNEGSDHMTGLARAPAERGRISDAAAFERALWTLAARFAHRSVVAKTAESTGHAMPAACWALLDHLQEAGPMRVSDIAACHGVDASSITPRLQTLEAEGLIERRRDAHDGRVSLIVIGEEGREALGRLRKARLDLFSRALTDDDLARLSELTDTLERISQSLHESLGTAGAGQRKGTDT